MFHKECWHVQRFHCSIPALNPPASRCPSRDYETTFCTNSVMCPFFRSLKPSVSPPSDAVQVVPRRRSQRAPVPRVPRQSRRLSQVDPETEVPAVQDPATSTSVRSGHMPPSGTCRGAYFERAMRVEGPQKGKEPNGHIVILGVLVGPSTKPMVQWTVTLDQVFETALCSGSLMVFRWVSEGGSLSRLCFSGGDHFPSFIARVCSTFCRPHLCECSC